jgi:hypothetical protein
MAGLVAMLTACSSDELIEAQQDPITFSVSTENVTRAASIATTDALSSFTLYADYKATGGGTTLYLNGGTVTKSTSESTTKWTLSDGDIYWPASGTLDFYAVANNDEKSYTHSTKKVTHSVNSDISKQTDLIYAVTTGQSKPETGTAVALHFRHALSQITFMAKCANAHLKIAISGVKLYGVKGSGTFSLPTSGSTTNDDSNSGAEGTWDTSSTTDVTGYEFSLTTPVNLVGIQAATQLSYTAQNMLLIPTGGATTAWNKSSMKPQSGSSSENTATTIGSYLGLKCIIYNYVKDGENEYTVQLWPNPATSTDPAYIYIPASFNWNIGHKYVYTFNFGGNTTGGYSEDGTQVLTPIDYTVDVKAFFNGTDDNKDVDM